jgi:hypothetical protein
LKKFMTALKKIMTIQSPVLFDVETPSEFSGLERPQSDRRVEPRLNHIRKQELADYGAPHRPWICGCEPMRTEPQRGRCPPRRNSYDLLVSIVRNDLGRWSSAGAATRSSTRTLSDAFRARR